MLKILQGLQNWTMNKFLKQYAILKWDSVNNLESQVWIPNWLKQCVTMFIRKD